MSTFDHNKPFRTKDGRTAILMGELPPGQPSKGHPLAVAVRDTDGRWSVETYALDGRFLGFRPSIWDLVNVAGDPVSVTSARIIDIAEHRA